MSKSERKVEAISSAFKYEIARCGFGCTILITNKWNLRNGTVDEPAGSSADRTSAMRMFIVQ